MAKIKIEVFMAKIKNKTLHWQRQGLKLLDGEINIKTDV